MTPPPFDLTGKTAVVTGSSRGLGEAIAAGLIHAGASVAALQRGALSQKLVALADKSRAQLTHIPVDMASEASIAEAIEQTLAVHDVDILVNNAGTQIRHDATDFPLSDFDAVMNINTRAVFQLCQGFAPGMLQRRYGKIINLASLLTFQGGFRVPAYAASKGAVGQLTKALCNEWAHRGINVNAIAPGYFSTEMNGALIADDERREQISDRIPAGRWGAPEDIAGSVVFLASDAANYVHGTVLPVDGGWLAR
ncbi:SDR family oxidoreductase [Arthrobacter sp. MA-N2]|uniref:SDR family oxidoreductase n=1 Tax=Arthrobacter sp. MA-N2 TaxID=1101188 RepID=UPI00048195B2|nr:SDR family oxidoreductase [Arthrobacter sp. MA-N2]